MCADVTVDDVRQVKYSFTEIGVHGQVRRGERSCGACML